MQVQGDYQLVCDPNASDPMQYYEASCVVELSGDNSPGRLTIYSNKATKAACEAQKGVFCSFSCLFSGKRSVEEDISTKWTDNCRTNDAQRANFKSYVSPDKVTQFECDKKPF